MADYDTNLQKKPTSLPKLLTGFTLTESIIMSPKSILDSKPFSALKNPFLSESNTLKTPTEHETKHKLDTKGIGLAIVDSLQDDPLSKPVLFGSQLRVQIPSLPRVNSPAESSPKTPTEFRVKTRGSQLSSPTPSVFVGNLSVSEIVVSEDYTCVISHGSNPRTTHIFYDCIVESCCGGDESRFESGNFLSFCCTCKKKLSPGKDIYMYRGEKPFCSKECRYQEMMLDEGTNKLESDDIFGTYS